MSIPPDPVWRAPAPRNEYPSPRSTFVENYLGEVLALGAAIIFAFGRPPAILALSFTAALLGVVRYERDRIRTLYEHGASKEAQRKARSPRRYATYAIAWGILLVLVALQSVLAEEPTPFGPGLVYGSVFVTNLLIYGFSVHRICELKDDRRRAVSDAESALAFQRHIRRLSGKPDSPNTAK